MDIKVPTDLQDGLVSIGVPVYNGARYLRQALDSLASQDYSHFEIIISDNASEDETEAICREYADRDKRVRYYRSEQNKGPFWNFARTYELARGEFFMWNSHDDLRDQRCLSLCVAALRRNPEAVMCCMGTRLIDDDGRALPEQSSYAIYHPIGRTRQERLQRLARTRIGADFYAIFRTGIIASTRFGRISVWGGDTVTTAEVCLRGQVIEVPEILFYYRQSLTKTAEQMAETLNEWGAEISPSWIGMVAELMEAVRLAPIGTFEKLRLSYMLATEMCVRDVYWRAMISADGFRGLRQALDHGEYRRGLRLAVLGSLCRWNSFYNRLENSFAYRRSRLRRALFSNE